MKTYRVRYDGSFEGDGSGKCVECGRREDSDYHRFDKEGWGHTFRPKPPFKIERKGEVMKEAIVVASN